MHKVTKTKGIYPLVRVVACFRTLVYGTSRDAQDEHFQISETEMDDTFEAFCKDVMRIFGPRYLNRCPTHQEKVQCLDTMRKRGFSGCFASWDCKHFRWRACPIQLAGQHLGKKLYSCKYLFLLYLCPSKVYLTL